MMMMMIMKIIIRSLISDNINAPRTLPCMIPLNKSAKLDIAALTCVQKIIRATTTVTYHEFHKNKV